MMDNAEQPLAQVRELLAVYGLKVIAALGRRLLGHLLRCHRDGGRNAPMMPASVSRIRSGMSMCTSTRPLDPGNRAPYLGVGEVR